MLLHYHFYFIASAIPATRSIPISGRHGELSGRTVNKYVEFVQQIVASMKSANGEPVHKRRWDAESMNVPVIKHSEQNRPSLKADTISKLIQGSSGQQTGSSY